MIDAGFILIFVGVVIGGWLLYWFGFCHGVKAGQEHERNMAAARACRERRQRQEQGSTWYR